MLGLARSGVYRKPRPTNDNDLEAMRRIDALFTARPFFGARRIAGTLSEEGCSDRPQAGATVDAADGHRGAGTEAAHQQPRAGAQDLSLSVARPDDRPAEPGLVPPISPTSRCGRGFLYLVAVIDWASRAVLSWRLSNTMDASFCVAALEEALARYGKPEIFNTDQGSQFTGAAFTGALIEAGVRISMDGRGRWMDNVFIERLWRSLKYEDVYLKGYADGREAKAGIGEYFAFYNERRLHQALGYRVPMAVWREDAAPAAYGDVDNASALTTCPQADQKSAADKTLGGLIKDNQQTAFQLNRRQKRSRFAGPLHRFRSRPAARQC